MIKSENKKEKTRKRHIRVRAKISGTAEYPRLAVYRSLKHIYAQIIDDVKGVTLVSSSSKLKELNLAHGGNIESAKIVGKDIAEKAIKAGIKGVVFDRGGFLFHGRIQALADAAREAGLEF
ncbi:MAG: 50S ribosomal protein L18 [Cyanobacteria bacterium SIG30]|nr:50S ribosomal protein L18 [Cyanobacteria bacterium SIG30]